MNVNTMKLIEYRLNRAADTLEDAEILFDNNKFFSAVNRIYYAMFYAVNALLLTRDLNSAKHSGVLGLFNKEFVNTGIIQKELGRFYNEMFEFRQKGDYKDLIEFNREDVKLWLDKGREFVRRLGEITKAMAEK